MRSIALLLLAPLAGVKRLEFGRLALSVIITFGITVLVSVLLCFFTVTNPLEVAPFFAEGIQAGNPFQVLFAMLFIVAFGMAMRPVYSVVPWLMKGEEP